LGIIVYDENRDLRTIIQAKNEVAAVVKVTYEASIWPFGFERGLPGEMLVL
jgi:hypothetical protein